MYKVYAGDVCILDPTENLVIDDPTVELKDNTAGSFTFTIYDDNPGYEVVKEPISTILTVYDDDEIIFKGRVVSYEKSFENGLSVEAEGELAYLNDTLQAPSENHNMTVRGYLEYIIGRHNAQVDESKQFTVGVVTVTDSNDSLYRYTNWECSLETIQDDLIDSLGGHIRVRYQDGIRYLDYLADYPRASNQKIEFGENLLDYTEDMDASDIATVCVPLGARLEESSIEALEERLTIANVNNGSYSIEIADAVAKYGRITQSVIFDNVKTAKALKTKGQEWLTDAQYSDMTLELSAVDLADFGLSDDHLKILDYVRCTSKPHGMDRTFPLTSMQIHLMNPDQNKYTLGSSQKSFAASTSKAITSNESILNFIPTKSTILQQAKDNATALITSCAKTGHIVFLPSIESPREMLIMDEEDYTEASRVWRFNVNGFGYSSTGYNGTFGTAITMDGAIVGDYLAAGSVSAEKLSVEYKTSVTTDISNSILTSKLYTDDQLKSYSTTAEVETKLQNTGNGWLMSASATAKGYADDALDSAKSYADGQLASYYTKAEIDVTTDSIKLTAQGYANTALSSAKSYSDGQLTSYYTKAEIDVEIDSIRQSVTSTAQAVVNGALTDYYTKSEIDVETDSITQSVTSNAQAYVDGKLTSYYTKSQIDTKVDSITLSVSNLETSVSNTYATKSELTVLSNQISSKVSTGDFATLITQNASSVQIAWNSISSIIQFADAQMKIYNGNSQLVASYGSYGTNFYYNNIHVGQIGTNYLTGHTDFRGIVFDLEYTGDYMTWAAKKSSTSSSYTMKMSYTRSAVENFLADTITFGCPVDMANHKILNPRWENGSGITGTLNFVQPVTIRSDGTIEQYGNASMTFSDGVLTSATWATSS